MCELVTRRSSVEPAPALAGSRERRESRPNGENHGAARGPPTNCHEAYTRSSEQSGVAPSRRELLAAGAAGAASVVGGCAGCAPPPTAELRLERRTDVELAERLYWRIPRGPTDDPADRVETDRLARTAIETGAATVETAGELPALDRGVYRETIYEFSVEVIDTRTVFAYRVRFDPFRGAQTVPDTDERVAVGVLPAVDQRVLADEGFFEERPPGVSTTLVYRPEERDASELVPEPAHAVLVWPDGAARIEVEGGAERTVRTYRLTSEAVGSAAARGRRLRETVGFRLSGVSDGEREILREARGAGYRVDTDGTPSEAFRELVDRFRPQTRARPDRRGESGVSGSYVLRWDGAWYWAELLVDDESFTLTP